MKQPLSPNERIVPTIWLDGIRLVLRHSLTLNGAIVIAVPTILRFAPNIGGALNAIFGVGVAGTLMAIFGFLILVSPAESGKDGVPYTEYRIVKNAALGSALFGSAALLTVGFFVYSHFSIPTWEFWIPICIGPAPISVALIATFYRNHRP